MFKSIFLLCLLLSLRTIARPHVKCLDEAAGSLEKTVSKLVVEKECNPDSLIIKLHSQSNQSSLKEFEFTYSFEKPSGERSGYIGLVTVLEEGCQLKAVEI